MKSKNVSTGLLALGSLGVVFGDIGTSPIYTLRQCIQDHPDPAHINGAVSLIVFYLLAIVSLKYVYFLLRLDNHGEGGVFALLALAKVNVPKAGWLVYTLIAGAAQFHACPHNGRYYRGGHVCRRSRYFFGLRTALAAPSEILR